jgi:hypothetical protein
MPEQGLTIDPGAKYRSAIPFGVVSLSETAMRPNPSVRLAIGYSLIPAAPSASAAAPALHGRRGGCCVLASAAARRLAVILLFAV